MPYAIVTGGTQGIGKAIAEKLLSEGYSVAVCARNKNKIASLSAEWSEKYPERTFLAECCDLSQKDEVNAFADKVLAVFPAIDLLVNNAGMYLPGELADEPDGMLETMIGANLYSAYFLSRRIIPGMKERKSGHIFNMCSVASLRAYPHGGAYSIAKYALLGFTENLREELRDWTIKVTAVCPGATFTPSWEGSDIPAGRIMQPEDVAAMVWAASNLSAAANVDTLVLRPVKGDL
jgi:NAD(P)-dependent dehydrogenase (short-subunit alcohol dehydrogenase family)